MCSMTKVHYTIKDAKIQAIKSSFIENCLIMKKNQDRVMALLNV